MTHQVQHPLGAILFLLATLLFLACRQQEASPPARLPTANEGIHLVVQLEKVRIHESASLNSPEIGIAEMGGKLPYAGSISEQSARLKLGGIWYDEPWIAILTPSQDTAWVYGGGVLFEGGNSEELAEFLLQKRMGTFFGDLREDMQQYRNDYANANNAEGFARVFHQGEELRDRLLQRMEEKIPPAEVDNMPDIFWIEDVVPGYVVELVAEGTQYYLFKDFRQLALKAQQTQGEEDDIFTDLALEIYDHDSIEHFYPAWFIQTWDYGGHSLLGSGKHNEVLALCDEVMGMSDYFRQDIDTFKEQLLLDITSPEMTYWHPSDVILTELESILQADYGILNQNDIRALEARLLQFKEVEKHGIGVGLENGE